MLWAWCRRNLASCRRPQHRWKNGAETGAGPGRLSADAGAGVRRTGPCVRGSCHAGAFLACKRPPDSAPTMRDRYCRVCPSSGRRALSRRCSVAAFGSAAIRESVSPARGIPAACRLCGSRSRVISRWVSPAQSPGKVVALVSPHAGYAYSGPTAAHAFAQVPAPIMPWVALIGPLHRPIREAGWGRVDDARRRRLSYAAGRCTAGPQLYRRVGQAPPP